MRIILLVLVLLAFPNLVFADQITVSVKIGGYKKAEISSYIKRELRELGDVDIVDSKGPDYYIEVASVDAVSDGRVVGNVLSFVLLKSFKDSITHIILETPPGAANWYWNFVAENGYPGYINMHQLVIGTDLKKLCQEFVAEMDGTYFENSRKAQREIEEEH